MKIKSINCKHTETVGCIACNVDNILNDDIIRRLNAKPTPAYFSMINGEKTVLKITVPERMEMAKGWAIIDEDDIEKINSALSEIQSDIATKNDVEEREIYQDDEQRRGMLKEIAKRTGLSLDCEE